MADGLAACTCMIGADGLGSTTATTGQVLVKLFEHIAEKQCVGLDAGSPW